MAEVKTKELAPIDEVYAILKKMEPEFALALPSNVTPEKFIRVVRTALQRAPELLAARRVTLYQAAMRCAQDGLIPDGREAALVVFGAKKEDGGEVQYMPMVAGLCKKARNSGEIETIDAKVVHANDEYDAWVDEKGQHFKHRAARGDRGPAILTYGYALTKDGGFFFEEIDEDQMKAIEKVSRAADGPWKGPFRDEMKRKSAIRRLAKYRLPSSADLEGVIASDDEATGMEPEREEPKPQADKPSRVGAIIEAQVASETPAEKPTVGQVPI